MKKILLVDDDLDLIAQNKMVIEERGYKVVDAYSGKKALEILKLEKFDLLVVDVMMENHVAGLNLAQEVSKTYSKTPIIILSGDPNKPNWMLQPGNTWNQVRYFLDKPIAPEALVKKIEEVIGHA